jgi:hypothetical protein
MLMATADQCGCSLRLGNSRAKTRRLLLQMAALGMLPSPKYWY